MVCYHKGMAFTDFVETEARRMGEQLWTITDVATQLGVTRQTIYNWLDAGRFPNSFVVGSDEVTLIPESDVQRVKREEADKLIDRLRQLGFRYQAVAA